MAAAAAGEGVPTVAEWPLSLDVLSTVRTMQQQHGMRSYDYGRYRAYCSRRLRRLHKTLRWFHGSGKKFVKKRVEPEDCSDSRFLVIMLLLAERAWAYGEELKAESAKKDNLALFRHYAARMRIAQTRAAEMCEVAAIVCDARTQREMAAYRSEMVGHWNFSKKDWSAAKRSYVAARNEYIELSKGHGSEARAVYIARAGDVDQAIRFCMHKLGEDPSTWQGAGDTGPGGSASGLSFLGRPVQVHSDKVRALITQGEQHAQEVARLRQSMLDADRAAAGGEEAPGPTWKRRPAKRKRDGAQAQISALNKLVDAYDKVFIAINDAISQVKSDLAQEKGGDAGGLHMLLNYLKYTLYNHTLERNLTMCTVHSTRYAAQEGSAGTKTGAKPTTPFDLVRLHDTVRSTVDDILAIPGVEDSPDVADPLSAQLHLHSGLKVFYQAEAFRVSCSDWGHAALLYEEAERELKEAFTLCRQKGLAAEAEVTAAHQRVRTAKILNRAAACWERHKAVDELGSAFQEQARVSGAPAEVPLARDPRRFRPCSTITAVPPDYEMVPCRPIFLDIAHELLPTASIDHRVTERKDAKRAREEKQRKQKHTDAAAGDAAAAGPGGPGGPEGGGTEGKKGWFGGWGWGKQ
eukprot:TRINITY_DN21393_c0_g1_i1.p1 TRINITY_DN21393_c0_g1~~TRINITY_DN21393_c0_g1_i1.p1  ORF type:complete len:634 (+),score=222.16 TRINITY_DN21393_c0_g1_i1:94-1995(+)